MGDVWFYVAYFLRFILGGFVLITIIVVCCAIHTRAARVPFCFFRPQKPQPDLRYAAAVDDLRTKRRLMMQMLPVPRFDRIGIQYRFDESHHRCNDDERYPPERCRERKRVTFAPDIMDGNSTSSSPPWRSQRYEGMLTSGRQPGRTPDDVVMPDRSHNQGTIHHTNSKPTSASAMTVTVTAATTPRTMMMKRRENFRPNQFKSIMNKHSVELNRAIEKEIREAMGYNDHRQRALTTTLGRSGYHPSTVPPTQTYLGKRSGPLAVTHGTTVIPMMRPGVNDPTPMLRPPRPIEGEAADNGPAAKSQRVTIQPEARDFPGRGHDHLDHHKDGLDSSQRLLDGGSTTDSSRGSRGMSSVTASFLSPTTGSGNRPPTSKRKPPDYSFQTLDSLVKRSVPTSSHHRSLYPDIQRSCCHEHLFNVVIPMSHNPVTDRPNFNVVLGEDVHGLDDDKTASATPMEVPGQHGPNTASDGHPVGHEESKDYEGDGGDTSHTIPLSLLFARIQGEWRCSGCLVYNTPQADCCVACETPKDAASTTTVATEAATSSTVMITTTTTDPSSNIGNAAATSFASSSLTKLGDGEGGATISAGGFSFGLKPIPSTSTSSTTTLTNKFSFDVMGPTTGHGRTAAGSIIGSSSSHTFQFGVTPPPSNNIEDNPGCYSGFCFPPTTLSSSSSLLGPLTTTTTVAATSSLGSTWNNSSSSEGFVFGTSPNRPTSATGSSNLEAIAQKTDPPSLTSPTVATTTIPHHTSDNNPAPFSFGDTTSTMTFSRPNDTTTVPFTFQLAASNSTNKENEGEDERGDIHRSKRRMRHQGDVHEGEDGAVRKHQSLYDKNIGASTYTNDMTFGTAPQIQPPNMVTGSAPTGTTTQTSGLPALTTTAFGPFPSIAFPVVPSAAESVHATFPSTSFAGGVPQTPTNAFGPPVVGQLGTAFPQPDPYRNLDEEPWYKTSSPPGFKKEILPILKKIGFKIKKRTFYTHPMIPRPVELNEQELREYLCQKGIPNYEVTSLKLNADERESLHRWVSFAFVPKAILKKIDIPDVTTIRQWLSTKFGFRIVDDKFYPPGDIFGIHYFDDLDQVQDFIRGSSAMTIEDNRSRGKHSQKTYTDHESLVLRLWAALSPRPFPKYKLTASKCSNG